MAYGTNLRYFRARRDERTKKTNPVNRRISFIIVGLAATCEILLASPLFAVLGFEYSALMALVLSLVCGLRVVQSSPSPEREWGWGAVFREVLTLATIPLA